MVNWEQDDISTEEIVIKNCWKPQIILPELDICSRCGAAGEDDICPYQQDVGGIIESCNCCESCRYNCLMDI